MPVTTQVKEYYGKFNKTLAARAVAVFAPDACKLVIGKGYEKASAVAVACRNFIKNVDKQRGMWLSVEGTSASFVIGWFVDSGIKMLCGLQALKTSLNPGLCKVLISNLVNKDILPSLTAYFKGKKQLAIPQSAEEVPIPEDSINEDDLSITVAEESKPTDAPLLWDNRTISAELPGWWANQTSPRESPPWLGDESYWASIEVEPVDSHRSSFMTSSY